MKTLILPLLIFFLLTSTSFSQEVSPDQTMSLDVVELLTGKEVAGDKTVSVEHEGFKYLFANDLNMAIFNADPDSFKVQLDGGCGRMGSLSGPGKTSLWSVHKKKIYVFASPGCKSGFDKDPKSVLESDDRDRRGKPTTEEIQLGREYLSKVTDAMGGALKIDRIRSYEERYEETVDAAGQPNQHDYRKVIDYKNQFALVEDKWNDVAYVEKLNEATESESFIENNGKRRPIYAAGRREFRRQLNRDLLTILKARSRNDFAISFLDRRKTEDMDQVFLSIHFDNSWALMAVDEKTNLVNSLTYRARGHENRFGITTRILKDYEEIDGVLLPHRTLTRFEGHDKSEERKLEIDLNVKPDK